MSPPFLRRRNSPLSTPRCSTTTTLSSPRAGAVCICLGKHCASLDRFDALFGLDLFCRNPPSFPAAEGAFGQDRGCWPSSHTGRDRGQAMPACVRSPHFAANGRGWEIAPFHKTVREESKEESSRGWRVIPPPCLLGTCFAPTRAATGLGLDHLALASLPSSIPHPSPTTHHRSTHVACRHQPTIITE